MAALIPTPAFQPVPRNGKASASRGWTPARQASFLAHLAATGSVTLAAKSCGLTRAGAYALRAAPGAASFAAAWDKSVQIGISALKAEAIDRAINGTTETVWHAGKQVGTRTRYNNQLTMRLLTHYDRAASPTANPPGPPSAPPTAPPSAALPPELEALLGPAIESRLTAWAKAKTQGNTNPEMLALNVQWHEAEAIRTNFALLDFISIVRHWLKEGGTEFVEYHLDRLQKRTFEHIPTGRIIRRELGHNGTKLDQSILTAAKTRIHAARTELYVKAGYID